MTTGLNDGFVNGREDIGAFTERLSREFGVFVDLRDRSFSKDLPKNYFEKNMNRDLLAEAIKELRNHKTFTREQWEDEFKKRCRSDADDEALALRIECKTAESIMDRLPYLISTLDKARQWMPGPQYKDYKRLLISQLEEGVDDSKSTLEWYGFKDDDYAAGLEDIKRKLLSAEKKASRSAEVSQDDELEAFRKDRLQELERRVEELRKDADATDKINADRKAWYDGLHEELDKVFSA
jgi:polyhydroxyalkanoate synthesis regulator phasin